MRCCVAEVFHRSLMVLARNSGGKTARPTDPLLSQFTLPCMPGTPTYQYEPTCPGDCMLWHIHLTNGVVCWGHTNLRRGLYAVAHPLDQWGCMLGSHQLA